MKDFRASLEEERGYLVRYARLQLRDAAAAEDAAQETLVAALLAEKSYAGRSSLRTWLTGILKHKIIDAMRKASREQPLPQDEGALDALFDASGHWIDPPQEWRDPDAALQSRQFLAVVEECLGHLPAKTARAFMMREHLGLETPDICKELAVTPTHCWVLLHRARLALRECLQMNWFGK